MIIVLLPIEIYFWFSVFTFSFNLLFTGNPDPLTNCTVSNQTSHTFQIDCVDGFDGGLEQSFDVALYSAGTNQLITSIKSMYVCKI